MDLPENIEAQIANLDPSTQVIIEMLRHTMAEQKAMLAERDAQIERLTEQLAELQRMLFGSRSEKLPPIQSEVRRVVEANELTVDDKPMPKDPKEQDHERRRKARKKSEATRKKKRGLRKNLPVVHERVAVSPANLPEGYSLEDFRTVGEGEVVRRVEHVREHLVTVEYRLETLASKDGEHIIKANAPSTVIEGGHYGPGVYAHAVTAKCVDSLPLHRIEKMFERDGATIARSTLVSLFHRAAELLQPIYARLFEVARSDPYVHADETTLRVQAEGQCLKGWIWVVLCKQAIAYVFDESRSGAVAQRILGDSKGMLTIDGYSAYNAVTDDDKAKNGEPTDEKRTRVGCWAHARRKFFEAMSSVPEAREVLDLIVKLYAIEHQAAAKELLGSEAHALLRDTQSREVVVEIEAWVDAHAGKFPPKSKMGKALTYATNQRKSLSRFLDDPKLALDNNVAERALRIIALGRKNFLFAGHVEGAQNLAVLQSVVATCTLHRVNPYEYVKDVLIRIQTHPASKIEPISAHLQPA